MTMPKCHGHACDHVLCIEQRRVLGALDALVASMHPHPEEEPATFAAWMDAMAVLRRSDKHTVKSKKP
jgi:hypothetical protein